MSRTDILAHSGLFAPLSEEERAGVARRFTPRQYQRDDYLFWEGEPAEWLVFVTEGQVKMIKHSHSGRETILATFGPGQIVLLSLSDKDILPLLQSVPAEVYWSQRRRQEEREEPHRWLTRLHRDPGRALAHLDQQFYQVVNAYSGASADAPSDSC